MISNELEFVRNLRIKSYEEYKDLVSEEHWSALKGTLTSDQDLNPGVEIFVMENEDKIVGSVALFPAKLEAYEWTSNTIDYPEIRMLAVEPTACEQGIGKSLIQHCIHQTMIKGYSHIGLHTADFMKNAILLYTKMGFERVPQLDFEPANDGVIVKGFRLNI